MVTEYIASTIPAQSIFVSYTTLYHISAQQFGDALLWPDLAELNGLTDPWIFNTTKIIIPPITNETPSTGILGLPTTAPLAITAPPAVTYPFIPAPPVLPYLNSNGAMALDPHGNLIV